MLKLKIIESNGEPALAEWAAEYDLTREITIGRDPDNTICIPDKRVSRNHARILPQNGTVQLLDNASANGTYVNGRRVSQAILTKGDEVTIGTLRLVLTADSRREVPLIMPDAPGTNLSIVMEVETPGHEPDINTAVDASINMAEAQAAEKSSLQGLQVALKRLNAMVQISTELGTLIDKNAVLNKILDVSFDIFPAADCTVILLSRGANEDMVTAAAKKRNPAGVQEEIAISRTVIKEVIEKRQSIICADAAKAAQFRNAESIINLGIRSFMAAPFICRGELLGMIQVYSQRGRQWFATDDLLMLTGIAAQAAVAIKNADLVKAVGIEAGRRRSLQRYFSPEIAERLFSGELSTELGGAKRFGTIFFSDIIGFTRMSENMHPAVLMATLNRYYQIMIKILHRWGGTVDKFGGDAIMACWGVPIPGSADERKALAAALSMQTALWGFNLELKAEGQTPIHMGIGLNTGEFIAGNIGGEERIEMTVIGENVNLAARLEAVAGHGQIRASEATWLAARDDLLAIKLPLMKFKNMSKPAQTYSIRGIRDDAGRILLNLPCAILGRQNEVVGTGLITEMHDGAAPELLMQTDLEVSQEAPLDLRLEVPCLGFTHAFTGTVLAVDKLQANAKIVFNRLTLGRCSFTAETRQFLQLGICPDSRLTSGQLVRE